MTKVKSEMTVEQRLRALYSLQLVDSRLDEIKDTRGELPLEVEDLKDDITQLENRIEKLETQKNELDTSIKTKKEEMKNSAALIKKYTAQQDKVRNNREFESLAKEIEYQELEIQLAEKRINEAKVKMEHKDEAIEEISIKMDQLRNHLKHKEEELEGLIKATEKEEQELAMKSEELGQEIEDRWLRAYKKIRNKVKNGLAVVPVERGASAGSFFTIPPQRIMEIAQRNKIMIDEHSGRILVDEDLAREEQEKMANILGKPNT